MVGRPQWRPPHHSLTPKNACDRVDGGDLLGLRRRQVRQQAGKRPRQHRLARARWPGEEHVVAAGRGNLEGAFGDCLRLDLGQVDLGRHRLAVLGEGRLDRYLTLAPQVRDHFDQSADRVHLEAGPGGLDGVGGRREDPLDAARSQVAAESERSTDWPHTAVETKLADEGAVTEPAVAALEAGLLGRTKNGHRDRQVESL